MKTIYLDNAATSFPKAPGVSHAMYDYMENVGVNINRGSYEKAYDAESVVFETREMLAALFNAGDPKNVVFTQNVTTALNFVIKGLLKPGDHVLTSSFEHNAVMRPLVQIGKEILPEQTAPDGTFQTAPGSSFPAAPDGTFQTAPGSSFPAAPDGTFQTAPGSSFPAAPDGTFQTAPGSSDITFTRIPLKPLSEEDRYSPGTSMHIKSCASDRMCGSEKDGEVFLTDTKMIPALIEKNTRAIILTHASNITGLMNPIEEIGRMAHEHGLLFIVDAAQTAGIFPLDMQKMNIDFLCFTGHKGLYGPQGIGGFIVKSGLERLLDPLVSGGTGSISHTEKIPDFMPDRFEPGTPNLPGIYGLNAALRFVERTGIDIIREHDLVLAKKFIYDLINLKKSKNIAFNILHADEGAPVVSLDFPSSDASDIAYRLETEYGICTRVGLHCAPAAHKAFGTYPRGTVRFSFGFFNTEEDVAAAINALEQILSNP